MLKRKEEARKTIEMIPTKKQEVSDDYFPSQVDMPKRPPWDFSMSKEEVEQREQKYFHVSAKLLKPSKLFELHYQIIYFYN